MAGLLIACTSRPTPRPPLPEPERYSVILKKQVRAPLVRSAMSCLKMSVSCGELDKSEGRLCTFFSVGEMCVQRT